MQNVIEKINNAKKIIILPHIREDADALGSCFAFGEVMKSMGKQSVCCVSAAIEERLEFIGGDYVVYSEDGEYACDLCVCLDCADIERLGDRRRIFDAAKNTVCIDHHYTNGGFADAFYIDGGASSTGEILCRLFKEMNVDISDKTARYLYIAICSDTGSFKYSNVTPETMRTAAKLLEYDFDHSDIARLLFDLCSLNEVKFKSEIMQNIYSVGGKINIVSADGELYKKYGISEENVPEIIDIPRSIAGTEIAVSIKKSGSSFRVSLRSNGEANVAEIALKFGGGGHARAAGCTIETDDLEKAKQMISEECLKVIK